MFIRWKRRTLGEQGFRSDVPCPHVGAGRVMLYPVVVAAVRVLGVGPRQTILWRPAPGIRSCCAEDAGDPIARARWWNEVAQRVARLRAGEDPNPFRDALLDAWNGFRDALRAVVPVPSAAEWRVFAAWEALEDDATWLDPYERYAARLEEARRAARRSQRTGKRTRAGRRRARVNSVVIPAAFTVLGVAWPCTLAAIKVAYRRGVFHRHPDQGGSDAEFIRWRQAYEEAEAFAREQGTRE